MRDVVISASDMPQRASRSRLPPFLRRAMMGPAMLRRAAVPKYDCACTHTLQPLFQLSAGSASLPGRLPPVLFSSGPRFREVLPRAPLRSRRPPCYIARLLLVSLRASGVRRCGPHCCTAPQC